VAKVRLTLTAKLFIAAVIVGVAVLIFYLNPGLLGKVAPSGQKVTSNIPPTASSPTLLTLIAIFLPTQPNWFIVSFSIEGFVNTGPGQRQLTEILSVFNNCLSE